MFDQIGTADMKGSLIAFTADRFGDTDSAMALNGDGTQVPSGIYFDTPEFSISVWIFPQGVGTWSRIIDFGNGPNSDNIVFVLSNSASNMPEIDIFSGSNWIIEVTSSEAFTLNEWHFIVATYDGFTANVYLNGKLTASLNMAYKMTSIQRSTCYIGKSEWGDPGSASYLDDLRFYNKSLTKVDIIELMNQNETSQFIFNYAFKVPHFLDFHKFFFEFF